jgi:hypothetical protein
MQYLTRLTARGVEIQAAFVAHSSCANPGGMARNAATQATLQATSDTPQRGALKAKPQP